jgi:tetratricopeptide (TPR) repeat protein
VGGFEAAQRLRAQEQERQGRLADAAWTWEVLTVLRPDNTEYRDSLAAVRRQADAAVAERLQRAQLAYKRGELDAATTQYLMVLSLQPDHAQAADALRSIERDRNRRSYLGKPSRITLARRGPAEVEAKPVASASTSSRAAAAAVPRDRNELEHVTLLAAQGELDEAIAALERRPAAERRDPAVRQLLADLYFQKADKLAARNLKPAAVPWLQKSLKLDAGHARAAALLKQLQAEAAGAGAGKAAAEGAAAVAVPAARSVR